MIDKKVTRKEFLLSALSIAGVVLLSKVPTILKKPEASAKTNNAYSNSAYGGSKKNA